ncbi:hypothetical protein GCM10010466_43200 [Planomonospora alba]|uniref:Uncharacterized protein n=1 Tax=Planomonospora alba TaxID=161354 RepID=A0ABP6NGS9_9ACTN
MFPTTAARGRSAHRSSPPAAFLIGRLRRTGTAHTPAEAERIDRASASAMPPSPPAAPPAAIAFAVTW